LKNIILLVFILLSEQLCAQISIGGNATLIANYGQYNNDDYLQIYDKRVMPGFDMGLVLNNQITKKISINTNLYYGFRSNRVVADQLGGSKVDYNMHYVQMPILLRFNLNKKPAHWFIEFGPNIYYLLGGQVIFFNYDGSLRDFVVSKFNYFSQTKNSFIDYQPQDINRLQLGLTIGLGKEWKVLRNSKMSMSLQYTAIHTFLSDEANPGPFAPDLMANSLFGFNGLGVSITYVQNITSILKSLR